MTINNQTKTSNFFNKIQLLFFILVLSLIATPSRSQSSDFLNRSEEEIRQENQQELDDKFDRVMNSAIDRIREADRLLGTPPSADEEIFLTQECREGNRAACDYLREIEQQRLRR